MQGFQAVETAGASAAARRRPAALAALLLPVLSIACAATPADEDVCAQGEPFAADGPLPAAGDRDAGDAHVLTALRHTVHPGCERVTIELARDDGTPAAGPGPVDAELIRQLGIVRVALSGIEQVEPRATDATFGGPLARAAYVVRSPDGPSVFVDVHLAEAAEAHVHTAGDPAQVVIALRPGRGPVPPPAPSAVRTVVLSPRSGEVRYPLTVSGYARTFEANVVVRLEQEGAPPVETFTTSTGYLDAWGYYAVTIARGPTGPVTLHAGEYSARDGSWEGVAIELIADR